LGSSFVFLFCIPPLCSVFLLCVPPLYLSFVFLLYIPLYSSFISLCLWVQVLSDRELEQLLQGLMPVLTAPTTGKQWDTRMAALRTLGGLCGGGSSAPGRACFPSAVRTLGPPLAKQVSLSQWVCGCVGVWV
jgi:hypothetical protein